MKINYGKLLHRAMELVLENTSDGNYCCPVCSWVTLPGYDGDRGLVCPNCSNIIVEVIREEVD